MNGWRAETGSGLTGTDLITGGVAVLLWLMAAPLILVGAALVLSAQWLGAVFVLVRSGSTGRVGRRSPPAPRRRSSG